MRSTYQQPHPVVSGTGQPRRFGLSDPATIEAYVNRRVNDVSLLSDPLGPRYADFFAA